MGNQPSCPQTGLAFLECVAGSSDTNQVKDIFTGLAPSNFQDALWNFYQTCTVEGQNPSTNLVCYNQFAFDVDWSNGMAWSAGTADQPFGELATYASLENATDALNINASILTAYNQTVTNVNTICGEELFDDIWPEFYHMYNTPNGKALVDAKIAALGKKGKAVPSACATALYKNYDPTINAWYGILNQPTSLACNPSVGQCTVGSSGIGNQTFMTMQAPWSTSNNLVPFNTSIWDTAYTQNFWGNPFWSTEDRQLAFSAAIGADYKTGVPFYQQWAQAYVDQGFAQAGQTAGNYFDPQAHPGTLNPYNDPAYDGNLPSKVSYQVGQEPWHRVTISPNLYGYANPCLNKPWLDSVMPYVGGAVSAGFLGVFVPGTWARVIAAVTGAVAGYSIVDNVFGFDATIGWLNGNFEGTNLGAEALAIGAPCVVWQLIYDLQIASPQMQSPFIHFGGLLAAGALGYYLIAPSLEIFLDVGGGLFITLSAPIAFLEEGITMLFNGCAQHHDWSSIDCDCEQANTKPLLAQAIVLDIYGCTKEQATLRLEAMHAAMTSGSWGSDPNDMGSCDGAGHMSTPIACLSAGEFAYQEFRPEVAQEATQMWNEISHVVDIKNRSFLPPIDADKDCVSKYGQYFRNDGAGGCADYRAPVGKQAPGQYNWSSLDSQYEPATCNIL